MDKLVEAWFKDNIATGEIARDTVAYTHAFAAKNDLVKQLAEEGADAAAVIGRWYQQQFIVGTLARNIAAAQQAEDAKAALVNAATGAKSAPKQPAPPLNSEKE